MGVFSEHSVYKNL